MMPKQTPPQITASDKKSRHSGNKAHKPNTKKRYQDTKFRRMTGNKSKKDSDSLQDPRFCAIKVICAVIDGMVLPDSIHQHTAGYSEQERRFIQHLSYGVLRMYDRLSEQLSALLMKPIKTSEREVHFGLLLSLYEVMFMSTAKYAAVNNWVSLMKKMGKSWATGLMNGILRGVLRNGLPDVDNVVARYNLPDWLSTELSVSWGTAILQEICQFYEHHPKMVLRVNLQQQTRDEYLQQLDLTAINALPHRYVDTAIVLDQPLNVQELPGFSSGAVSVQDASAQLASRLIDFPQNATVLDACAAPGGKTMALLEQHLEISTLIALDSSRERLEKVHDNQLRIFGADNTRLHLEAQSCETYKASLLFDFILLDVPCSGTGIIHRHPDIKRLRRAEDIAKLVEQQQKIIDHAWNLLKDGGILLYCTCSILKEENERQIMKFFERHEDVIERPIQLSTGYPQEKGWQILPVNSATDEVMDGFYYCLLEKKCS